MPSPRDLPLLRWSEDLQRRRIARRRCRSRIAAAAGAASVVTCVLATLLFSPRPRLIWNASASSPPGLYAISDADDAGRGDIIVATLPPAARDLAAARGYLPPFVPLVKGIAGIAGDRICSRGDLIFVNDRPVATRRREDPAGRPLPRWTGCETLGEGDFFLLAEGVAASFDGRYFGITRRHEVIGHGTLLWGV